MSLPTRPDTFDRTAAAASATGPTACGEAVERAIASLGATPGLVLFFPAGDVDPVRAASDAQEAAGNALVAGMTGTAAIGDDGFVKTGCSALAFSSSFCAGVGAVDDDDPAAAGHSATAKALAAVDESLHQVVLLFVDSESGDQAEVVAGAYAAAGGKVPLAGGAAGGRSRTRFAGGRALTEGVVAVAIGSKRPIGVGIAHGCVPRGTPSIVTRADGPNVIHLDGRPAQDVYFEKLGIDGDAVDDEEFEVLTMVHPLAEPELSGAVRPRYLRARGPDGALVCATRLERNAAVEICDQTADAIVESARAAVADAVSELDGPAEAAIVFDCAARAAWSGGAIAEREHRALTGAFGNAAPRIAGACTRGEIGRARGAKGDRNHSVVVVALGAPD